MQTNVEELPLLPLSVLVKFGFPEVVSSSPGHGPIFPVRIKNFKMWELHVHVVMRGRKIINSK